MGTDQLDRAAASIDRLGDEARTVVELCEGVHDALSPLVPTDRWCGFALDPATLLPTNGRHEDGIPVQYLPRLLALEHGTVDVNHIPALARSSSGVSTIAEATNGDHARSARWRDVLDPPGCRRSSERWSVSVRATGGDRGAR
jgi:hypothetical protein